MMKNFNYNRISVYIILGVALLTVMATSRLPKLAFDYDFEKFFPKDHEDSKLFEKFRQNFESDYDYLLIGIHNPEGSIFRPEFLEQVNMLCDSIAAIPGITEVVTPTGFKMTVKTGLFASKKKLLHIHDRERLIEDSTAIFSSGFLKGVFFSEDATSLSVLVKTEELISKKKSDVLLLEIERLIELAKLKDVYTAGKLKAQKVYIDTIQVEFTKFFALAGIFVIVLLLFTFRSLQGVWVPLIVVLIAVLWTVGFMEFFGKKIDILSSLLPTIMFVVGISDSIHIYSKYLDEIGFGREKIQAIKNTIREVGLATFLTSFTTAIGFLSLVTSGLSPVVDLGLYTAAGVMFAYVVSILLMPAVFVLAKAPAPRKASHLDSALLRNVLMWVFRNYKAILSVSALFFIAGLYATSRLEVNNFLIEDLRDSAPLKQNMNRFEREFSGVRPFEVFVEVTDNSHVMDYKNILALEKVEAYLQKTYKTGYMASPVTLIKMANVSLNSGLLSYFRMPANEEEFNHIIKELKLGGAFESPEFLNYVTADGKMARLSAKMPDLGSKFMNQTEEEFIAYLAQNFSQSGMTFRLTGSARLIDKNIMNLTINLLQGLGLAFLIISIIVGLLFRSFKMVLIALIVNIMPLIIVAAIMAIFNITLKTSTAIIFTIGFGIAVDDTIHFLSRLRIELNEGKPLFISIKRTFLSTGKAILLTTLILVSGFLPMIASDFLSTYFLGLLLSVILVFALLADLLVLPALLIVTYKSKKEID